ncbi:MAG: flagellar biosynthesis anti-sigma factor FlgM [Planctomycetes bacterium]|nr:flagellar biosynthesis anti-sigma factor FlgM [Planctomycetota bacterium]
MYDVVTVTSRAASQPALFERLTQQPAERRSALPDSVERDEVELSQAAREYEPEQPAAPIRTDLVERIREDIAGGRYLTPDKLDIALERLLGELVET